ncbi:hypothetical protein K491DRAFT_784067 [Lophiostoma macrostomum CBS 122681]|uniref:Uncharacterized protein n=1 Tax=Lophiostoma macrostomum CBS 122681 TaxID=1314788 RepID=A0A6A6SKN5_9PLEO|nr:hypothetical protein K491DRAFT_784067 [Lophiostoma macrostomum CBS 122681]
MIHLRSHLKKIEQNCSAILGLSLPKEHGTGTNAHREWSLVIDTTNMHEINITVPLLMPKDLWLSSNDVRVQPQLFGVFVQAVQRLLRLHVAAINITYAVDKHTSNELRAAHRTSHSGKVCRNLSLDESRLGSLIAGHCDQLHRRCRVALNNNFDHDEPLGAARVVVNWDFRLNRTTPNVENEAIFVSGGVEHGREIIRETYTEDRMFGRVVIDLNKRRYAPIRVNILERMIQSVEESVLRSKDKEAMSYDFYGRSLKSIEKHYETAQQTLSRKRARRNEGSTRSVKMLLRFPQ